MSEDDQGLGLVIGLSNKILTTLILSICISLGLCFSSATVLAQSPSASLQPVVSLPPLMTQGPVPGGVISGYVFDENRTPVPGANVTLWYNAQVWQPTNYDLNRCVNPQRTNIAYSNLNGYLKEGSFEFGFLYPGKYILTVEKDGFTHNSTDILIGNDTMRQTMLDSGPPATIVNITLIGYHLPTITPEQQSHTGAITGNLLTASGLYATGVNISLWRDGQLVDRSDNPQSSFKRNYSGAEIDYLFEHLAPGNYTVMAEYSAGEDYNDTVVVDVDTSPMRADIILSRAYMRPANFPVISFTPTVGKFVAPDPNMTASSSEAMASESKQTPALPWFIVLIIIGSMACILRRKNER